MLDAIVIGAGLGGLTAAAKLARGGKRVVVLEKHARPGGCATTFRRRHFEVDVSLHLLDGFDETDKKARILKDLDVLDHLTIVPVPELYRFVRGDRDIVLPKGLDNVIDSLSAAYPDDSVQLRRILRSMAKIREEVSRFPFSRIAMTPHLLVFPFLYPYFCFGMRGSIGHFLDRRLKSDELKLALTANLSFFHEDPYSVSSKYVGLAQGSFLEAGGCYIKGGSQRLANRLRDVIEENGGEVRCRHTVKRLHTAGSVVTGVEVEHRGRRETLTAKHVLANAAVPHVLNDLLGAGADPSLERRVGRMEVGPSVLTLYMGFDKPLKALGSRYYSNFVYDDSVRTQRDVKANYRGGYDRRIFGFTDYSQIDSGLAPEGKGCASLSTLDYMRNWDLDESAYRAKKAEVTEILLERVEALVPGAREHLAFSELGTPRTVRRYTNNTDGAFGGYAQTLSQSLFKRLLRVRSGLKNLHFAGAWQFPGGGYTCAMLSGYLQGVHLLEYHLRDWRPRLGWSSRPRALPASAVSLRDEARGRAQPAKPHASVGAPRTLT